MTRHIPAAPLFIFPLFLAIGAGIMLLVNHGCASIPPGPNPHDVEQRAFALYGAFAISEDQAAHLVNDPNVAASLKMSIRYADTQAKKTADTLLQRVNEFEHDRARVKAGTMNAAQLTIVTEDLDTWLTEAATDIQTLTTTVRGANP